MIRPSGKAAAARATPAPVSPVSARKIPATPSARSALSPSPIHPPSSSTGRAPPTAASTPTTTSRTHPTAEHSAPARGRQAASGAPITSALMAIA